MESTVLPGKPYPLGAKWDGTGVNFAIFSDMLPEWNSVSTPMMDLSRIAMPSRNRLLLCGTDISPASLPVSFMDTASRAHGSGKWHSDLIPRNFSSILTRKP